MFKRPGCRKPLSARALASSQLPGRAACPCANRDGGIVRTGRWRQRPAERPRPLGVRFPPLPRYPYRASRGSVRAGTRHKRQLQTRHLKAILKAGDHGL